MSFFRILEIPNVLVFPNNNSRALWLTIHFLLHSTQCIDILEKLYQQSLTLGSKVKL